MGAQSKRKATEAEASFRATAYATGGSAKDDEAIWAKVAKVVTALKDGHTGSQTTFPAGVLNMLAAGAKGALSAAAEDRHELQELVCAQIREVFDDVAAGIEARAKVEHDAADAMKADVDKYAANVMALEKDVTDATQSTQEKDEELKTAKKAAADAEQALTAAKKSQGAVTKERAAFEADLEKYKVIEEGNMKMLLEGEWTDEKEASKAADKLMKDLEKIGAEAALLSSAPPVLLKKPAERKGFDGFVLETLGAVLVDTKKVANAGLEATAGAAAAAEADVAATESELQEAKKACDAAAVRVEQARAHAQERAAVRVEARKVGTECQAAAEAHHAGVAKVDAEVEAFALLRQVLDELVARANAPVEETEVERKVEGEAAAVGEEPAAKRLSR